MARSIQALALFARTLSAQVDVTVSRQVAPGATEGLFTVEATAVSSTGLPQVAAALEPVSLRAEHLRSAVFQRGIPIFGTSQTAPATVSYSFELRVPAARFEGVSAEMDRIFGKPPAPLTKFTFSGRLTPGVAALETARLALLPALFEEARAKAEAALTVAGQSPGPILALQDEISANYDASATANLSMRMARSAPASGASFGRSVVAAVSRPITVPFDVAVISITTATGIEEALRKLAALGVTAADLSSQSSNLFRSFDSSNSSLSIGTSFQLTRPATELPRLIDALAKLGMDFSASLEHSSTLRAREQEKALPALLAAARSKAEPLARLLNLPLGSPRLIRDGDSARSVPIEGVSPVAFIGNFVLGAVSFGRTEELTPTALTVEFAVD